MSIQEAIKKVLDSYWFKEASPFEKTFMKSISDKKTLSAKQLSVLMAIAKKCLVTIEIDSKPRKSAAQKTRPTPSASFAERFNEADMPEKINGVWVDLETGLRI